VRSLTCSGAGPARDPGRAGPGSPGPPVLGPRVQRPRSSALTAAELRLLPLLPTHWSFPQIAAEMALSRSTIKSQAMSIYRKLGGLLLRPGSRPVP
jgi:DNA-binding NarL/FixJ family response regulator